MPPCAEPLVANWPFFIDENDNGILASGEPTASTGAAGQAAQFTVMENANALATKAIRTCGGQAMLKSLPLERIYRDSRCGSLMLPWTAEICVDRIGRDALYEPGETDE